MKVPRELVFGMAGHIDHGKSALLRALTGAETDRLPAEKERGITIDLGFAALQLGTGRVSVVDVPGHQRFVRNMLAGATGIDLAVLVVAADDSVMPQTREHLDVLRLLGLAGGVVALTKCDLADEGWLELVEADVRGLVAGTFLEGAAIVRTSSTRGAGVDALKRAMDDVARTTPPRLDPGPFRMAIDRSFTLAGRGTVVTGTVASGAVSVGDELEWFPSGRSVRVRGLHEHGQAVDTLGQGARAAINLTGAHHAEIARGDTLAAPGYLKTTRVLGATIAASENAPRALRHRGRYRVHLGTGEETATLGLLGCERLEPGESGFGQLLFARDVVAVSGQPFVLRQESPAATVGGGRVLRPTGPRTRRRDRSGIDRLARRGSPDAEERLLAALEDLGIARAGELDLCREAAVPPEAIPGALESLVRAGRIADLPLGSRRTVRLARGLLDEAEGRVLRALGRLHERSPRQSAIRRAHLLGALADLSAVGWVDGLVDRLIARGEIVGDAQSIALARFEPRLSHAERRLKAELLDAIEKGGDFPPDVSDLSSRHASRASLVPELLGLLAEEGKIVAIAPHLYYASGAERSVRERVGAALADGGTLTMAGLRDLLGTTRKYAVPIGEHLDRIGLTVRDGDVRRLGEAGRG